MRSVSSILYNLSNPCGSVSKFPCSFLQEDAAPIYNFRLDAKIICPPELRIKISEDDFCIMGRALIIKSAANNIFFENCIFMEILFTLRVFVQNLEVVEKYFFYFNLLEMFVLGLKEWPYV